MSILQKIETSAYFGQLHFAGLPFLCHPAFAISDCFSGTGRFLRLFVVVQA
jgi:hypothetical protein